MSCTSRDRFPAGRVGLSTEGQELQLSEFFVHLLVQTPFYGFQLALPGRSITVLPLPTPLVGGGGFLSPGRLVVAQITQSHNTKSIEIGAKMVELA